MRGTTDPGRTPGPLLARRDLPVMAGERLGQPPELRG
jgi:hypothetical protein